MRTFVLGVIDRTKGAARNISRRSRAGNCNGRQTCSSTDDCFYALDNQTFAQDLKAALDKIELQAFDNSFEILNWGGSPDLSKLNVQIETTS